MGRRIPNVHVCSEILCPDSEGVTGSGLICTGTGTAGDHSEQTGSPLTVSLCSRFGLPLPRRGIQCEGQARGGVVWLPRTLTYQCVITFPRLLLLFWSPGVFAKPSLPSNYLEGFFFFSFFSPFLLPSDFEISSVTQPFDFLLIPGSRVLSAHSPSCFSEAALHLNSSRQPQIKPLPRTPCYLHRRSTRIWGLLPLIIVLVLRAPSLTSRVQR